MNASFLNKSNNLDKSINRFTCHIFEVKFVNEDLVIFPVTEKSSTIVYFHAKPSLIISTLVMCPYLHAAPANYRQLCDCVYPVLIPVGAGVTENNL